MARALSSPAGVSARTKLWEARRWCTERCSWRFAAALRPARYRRDSWRRVRSAVKCSALVGGARGTLPAPADKTAPHALASPRRRPPIAIARIGNCPKRSLQDVLGAGKVIFLVRDIDGPTTTAGSVESCRFVVRRSPWGRFWVSKYMCNRLRRLRRRFQSKIYLPWSFALYLYWP